MLPTFMQIFCVPLSLRHVLTKCIEAEKCESIFFLNKGRNAAIL